MRLGVLAALALVAPELTAHADAWLEGTGFVGVDDFSSTIKLGDSLAPEQRPQTAPMFGGRLTRLFGVLPRLEVGGEAELSFTPSWTGYGFDGPRPSYFAPVLGYRLAALARVPLGRVSPFVLVGGGGETVVTGSPFMSNTTDAVFFYGVGVSADVAPGWQMRLDARQTFMPSENGGWTANYQLLAGVGTRFGKPRVVPVVTEHEEVAQHAAEPAKPDPDSDGDGIPDRLDACPLEPESKNGIDDDDGCPEPDPDGDGIVGKADKCPDQAEDFDHFQDEDGCPDPDNDSDGIVDAKDACPNQPETRNGFDDDDGCPDTVPDAIAAAVASATATRFEAGKVRLTEAGKLALDKSLVALRTHPTLHVVVVAHPATKDDDKATELAKKRAEVVKWYLVEQGIPADQVDTAIGPPSAPKGPAIELAIAPKL